MIESTTVQRQLTVSVIIPTKNRSEDLAATIQSVLAQSRLPVEIVIVDQSEQKSFTRTVAIQIQYVHNPNLTGLTAARNAAMRIAKGDILLFLDDDVLLEADFIEQIAKAYSPDVTGVSGIITNYYPPPWSQRVWETLFLRGPFQDDRQRIYRNAHRFRESAPIRTRQMGGGLMSFRASSVNGLLFDENLTGSCPAEDWDFCAMMPKGSKLLIAPKARLVHNRSGEGRAKVHWLATHAQASNYLRQRHWRKGIWNNLCFAWLNVGYVLVAVLGSVKRGSFEPWRAWREGARKGIEIAKKGA